ncbi:MAG: hypothetical protein GDA68_07185 [Nitrospira sp. CR2.1]|nr:hypothetical protein [Nitrospira sp. CR2.1]
MPETSLWPIRPAGWAVRFLPKSLFSSIPCLSALLSGVPLLGLLCLLLSVVAASQSMAQPPDHSQPPALDGQAHLHNHPSAGENEWEGSRQGIAYSEFNHHLAGVFLLLIGLGEMRQALGWRFLAWTRALLPGALIIAGVLLLIWSDHDAWPVGSMTVAQTFGGGDPEVLQHKVYGILALAVGIVEWSRRVGWSKHALWAAPLPLFAIVGGLMLFGHSHGDHPAAQKIALHHVMMGTMAITAGSSKLISGWRSRHLLAERSYWDLLWASLVVAIGLQLLIYSE